MDCIKTMKSDLYLKDNELFLLYDIINEKILSFCGKFDGDKFFVVYNDGAKETGTDASYGVLRKIMEASYVPVNANILILGRKRCNYYMQAVEIFMNTHNYEYNVPFAVENGTGIVRRYGDFEMDDKKDLKYFFENLLFKK